MENIIIIKHPTPVYSVNLWIERWEKSLNEEIWLSVTRIGCCFLYMFLTKS